MRRDQMIPGYDSPLRRRARSLSRVAAATARNRAVTSARVLPAFWWDGHPNFGDALTPWLLSRYGFVPVHTPPSTARLAGVGSILEQLPVDFDGVVWGSGLLYGRPVELPRARFLAVRGPLTQTAMGIAEDVALGDPGILVGQHLRRPAPRWRLGLVPHGLHSRDPGLLRLREGGAHVVDVSRPPAVVLREIAACEAVVSTSLHGVITADAFGIPAAWTQREPVLWGADFKFRDYEAVMTPGRGREISVGARTSVEDLLASVALADGAARARSIAALEATLADVPAVTDRPWTVFRHRDV